jgi:hypothetical protein
MTMTELLPTLNSLNRAEKLRVMHYLVIELEKDENILPPGTYPVWSPFDSYEAANALMEALKADKAAQG